MERYFIEHAYNDYFLYTEEKIVEYAQEIYSEIEDSHTTSKELSILTEYTLESLEDADNAISMLNEYFSTNSTEFIEAIVVH